MADAKANLIIELKDKVSAEMSKIGGALNSLKQNWLGITAAVAAVGGAIYATIKAFGEQEQATMKLNAALKNVEGTTAGATKRLTEQASALQKQTTYGDEAIINMQALLATFKLNESTIATLTPKILDMAAATGTDLNSAAMAVGKTLATGTVGMLQRYGVVVDETKFKTDGLSAVTGALTSQFGGMSTAIAGTTLGRMEQLKNQFGDLMENIGALLVGPATAVITWLQVLIEWLNNSQIYFAMLNDVFTWFVEMFVNGWLFIQETLTVFWTFFEEFANAFQMILTGNFPAAFSQMQSAFQNTINGMIANWDRYNKRNEEAFKRADATDKAIIASDKLTKDTLTSQQAQQFAWQEKATEDHNKKQSIEEKKKLDESRKRNEDHFLNMQKLRQQEEKEILEKNKREEDERKRFQAQKISDWSSTLGTISSLTQSNDKALFIAGKAAAMANAVISIAQGIAKALSLGPIVGPPMAALVAAAGAVQIRTISAQHMAEGGIVMPTAGGTLARIGEAGQAEAVIPLDDERSSEFLGGQTTININAGVVVADDESIRKLAEMIDSKLYDLSRNNLSVTI